MYTSLRNQLIALSQGTDISQCGYTLGFICQSEKSQYKGTVYKTPDDALQWIYDDAHKRGLPYIHVACTLDYSICFGGTSLSERPVFLGFHTERSALKMIIHEDVKNNLIWSMDETGICGRDDRPECLAYPNEKPQFELLDFIRGKDKEWCRDAAHMSVAEYENKSGYSSASRDMEDVYTIGTGTRPPNSLPINQFTCDICKVFDMRKFSEIPEDAAAESLTDDQLMLIIKNDGGEIPKNIVEQA